MSSNLRSMPSWLNSAVDRIGMSAAFACAIHCAAIPVVMALAPSIGLGFLGTETFELGFVGFAYLLGISSILLSYRRHGRFFAWWFIVPGLAILSFERFFPWIHEQPVQHAVVMTAGGLLVGLAHLVNLRLSHGHVHDVTCEHSH